MALHTLPSVASVGRLINDHDYPHKLAMVILVSEDGKGWCRAVVSVSTGDVLSWDGDYFEKSLSEEYTRSLLDYNWSDWDDMPSKLILDTNAYWLGVTIDTLMPSYSIDVCAAGVLSTWFDNEDRLNPHRVVAYYPCNVEHVIAEVQKERDLLAGRDFGYGENVLERQDLLLAQLRAL